MTQADKAMSPAAGDLYAKFEKGTGTPIVFLNSLAADHSMWNDVAKRLQGRTMLRYDARGHGRSAVYTVDCTAEDLGHDLLALMDAKGIDRAVLCGLSLGGSTAMWIAGAAPDRVAGLVLANTATSFPPASMWEDRAAKAREEGMRGIADATIGRWLTETFRNAAHSKTQEVLDMIVATPPEGYAACCMALAGLDVSDALAAYDGPALVIAGRHDQSTPLARAKEMKTLCPQADIVELDAAHLSSVETPSEFATCLDGFMRLVETRETARAG